MSEVIGEIVEHTYKDIWENLSRVDVSSQAKKKNGLTYLSWAWAWGDVASSDGLPEQGHP